MESVDIAIVGGGAAGLWAAEAAASAGRSVTVFDGKPSMGRKFLVAGKGGLNLTHGESPDRFISRYSEAETFESLLSDFSPGDLRQWCEDLGQETFQASSGRIYPKALKGAPVLRAWLAKLNSLGVEFRPRHRWTACLPGNVLRFENGLEVKAKSVVFALGGASWSKTGSDGSWVETFQQMGVSCEPLKSSNCGWEVDWPESLRDAVEGMPLKNIEVKAGGKRITGELMVTRYGLEGGGIYALGSELRKMEEPVIEIDFKPTFSEEQLVEKFGESGTDLLERASRRWKLSEPAKEILGLEPANSAKELAARAKSCRITLKGPRPIDEAISSAGGVSWDELDGNLMLKKFPGIFVCGEMIDWDAPTGGYLMQGCFATGSQAGKAASVF
jgi:uncharacterized flavoprotein (TIGR03862 family)